MANPTYDIYFRGEILPGADKAQVKAAIARIFNADDAKLAILFSGRVNTIKKAVDKVAATKYQQAFKQAGAKAVITLSKTTSTEAATESQAQATNPANKSVTDDGWDVLPSGSDLLKPNERRNIPDADIDTSAIRLVSPFAEVEVDEKIPPPAPDTAHISVADVGEDMNPDRVAAVPSLELDLSKFSVAEIGSALADKKEKKVPSVPDTNHIKLA
ncbi:MAG: hypothetical protein HRU08_12060 [Oleispira sp.]|nr:hypothetical protein [Oleispira sp.]